MDEEIRKSFEKYIKPNTVEIVFGIILIIIGIAVFVYGILIELMQIGLLFLGYGLLFGIVFIVWGVVKNNTYKKNLESYVKKDDLPDILEDYEKGKKMFDDTLILGKYFIIKKGSGIAIEYSEVKKFYQLVKGSGERGKRIIQIQTLDKKKYELCRVPIHNAHNNDLSRLLGYISAKNNNIQM